MIYPLIGLLIGALAGALIALKRKGRVLDILQYGAVLALIGGIAGLFVLVIIERSYI